MNNKITKYRNSRLREFKDNYDTKHQGFDLCTVFDKMFMEQTFLTRVKIGLSVKTKGAPMNN